MLGMAGEAGGEPPDGSEVANPQCENSVMQSNARKSGKEFPQTLLIAHHGTP